MYLEGKTMVDAGGTGWALNPKLNDLGSKGSRLILRYNILNAIGKLLRKDCIPTRICRSQLNTLLLVGGTVNPHDIYWRTATRGELLSFNELTYVASLDLG